MTISSFRRKVGERLSPPSALDIKIPEHKSCEIFYKVGEPYEITLNPCDGLQHLDDVSRLSFVYDDMSKLLIKYFGKDTQYKLYPEISEPKFSNKKGSYPRIHFHGNIKFTTTDSLGEFLLCKFNKLRQGYSIQLNNYRPEHWPKYCKKQKAFMKPLLASYDKKYIITNLKLVRKKK